MSQDASAVDIWTFVLRLWKRQGVERAALVLQDQHGVSVCLVLAALWLAARDVTPAPQLAARLAETADEWERQRIAPLRALRREAARRPAWGDWKRSLSDAELEAERLLLRELATLADEFPVALGQGHAEAWLLLVLPEAAQCESLTRALGLLREACEG